MWSCRDQTQRKTTSQRTARDRSSPARRSHQVAAESLQNHPAAMPSKDPADDLMDPMMASAAAFHSTVALATGQDFLSRDVDQLVAEIKENLRLTTSFKSRCQRTRTRPSPYRVPSVSGGANARKTSTEDTEELLQVLIREGGLIKEAVRRLQEGLNGATCSGNRVKKGVLRELDEGACTPVALCGVDA